MSKFTLVTYITFCTVTSFLDFWNLTTQTALYLINSPTTLSFLPNDGTAFLVFCTSTKCIYFFEADQTTEGAKEILVNHLLYFRSELSFCEEARYFRSKGLWILIPPLTKISCIRTCGLFRLSSLSNGWIMLKPTVPEGWSLGISCFSGL